MTSEGYGICVSCHDDLQPHLDADPNGEMDCVCARCRAEEEHNFSRSPNAKFDRAGNLITRKATE